MAYENLKTAIKQAIKQNGNQEITGDLLQSTLLNIVNTLGADYKFLGFASPSTVPPTSEEGRLFYFASKAGEYINFPTTSENTHIVTEEGLYLFTKEANSDYWKYEILIEVVQELGNAKDKVISQKTVSTEFSSLLKKLEAEKLKKIPILNSKICKDGSRYIDIENLILDLEIISNSEKNFAPVVFNLDENNEYFSIRFYEVDASGKYLLTLNSFNIKFNTKERKLLYVLNKKVSATDYTAEVSIAIDSSAITDNFDAYAPSFVSDAVRSKHWGIIEILRQLSNIDTKFDKLNVVQELGNAKDKVISQKTVSTEFSSLLKKLEAEKLKKIPILNSKICKDGSRYIDIENLILDLEIISNSEKNFAPVVFNLDENNEYFSIRFYEVDASGKYLLTLNSFNIKFNTKERKLLYVLNKKVSATDYTAEVSIAIDSSAITDNFDAYAPSFVSDAVRSKHWGIIEILRQLSNIDTKFDKLNTELGNINLQQVQNGNKIIFISSLDMKGNIVYEQSNKSFKIKTSSKGYEWCAATAFTPSGKNYIHIKCKLKDLTPDLNLNTVTLWLSDGRISYAEGKAISLGRFTSEIDYEFDPAYYTVYKGWTQFNVWLSISASTSGGTKKWEITDFETYELAESVNSLSGDNAKELFENVASKLSDINSEIAGLGEADTELISPSGNKFELSVQDDGTLKALPIIPNKGAFFGNSLLVGSGYGMAASDDQHDYYYLINSYIKSLNGSYTYNKYKSSGFEGITSKGMIESVVNAVVNNLTGDETLVSIQLGDNVNTVEKNAVFPASSLALCKAIRIKCPNARVVWMGMWYSSDSKYQAIQNACKQTGCKFISYEGLKGSDASSKIGNIQKKSSAERTISGVTNVVENSSLGSTKNITVTFTVGGNLYTSTLDVSSYSLSKETLTYTSEYDIITAGGIASHPGDEGFRRISNRFLYEMKLTDDQEYYKKL